MPPADPFNLERFVSAQGPVFDTVLAELRAARKRSHWIWFIFPQLAALGHSPTAKFYGIASLEEARAYLGNDFVPHAPSDHGSFAGEIPWSARFAAAGGR